MEAGNIDSNLTPVIKINVTKYKKRS